MEPLNYWVAKGKEAVALLSPEEVQPFIQWLERSPEMLPLYEQSPSQAVAAWKTRCRLSDADIVFLRTQGIKPE